MSLALAVWAINNSTAKMIFCTVFAIQVQAFFDSLWGIFICAILNKLFWQPFLKDATFPFLCHKLTLLVHSLILDQKLTLLLCDEWMHLAILFFPFFFKFKMSNFFKNQSSTNITRATPVIEGHKLFCI